ncbi:MAG: transaldolase family protein [Christensenellales bacterium]|jgi:transaldolase
MEIVLYSRRLERETPTRFFVNNPTPSEAKAALDIGNVIGVVTNGNYLKRMLTIPETKDYTIAFIDKLIRDGIDDDELIVALATQNAVNACAKIWLPIFECTNGEKGWVAIQGNPNHDTDYDFIVSEANRFYTVSPNVRVKFPATKEAIKALESMTALGKATLATCGFSVQYTIEAIEAYQRGCKLSKRQVPRLYVTLLAGHIDEYLAKYVKANNISISPGVLSRAGVEIAKTVYKLWYDRYRNTNSRIVSSCRELYHFTEMVPGDMSVTVNHNFIKELNNLNPNIDNRISMREPDSVFEELKDTFPVFDFSTSEKSTKYGCWSMLPTALYFRNYVRSGWDFSTSIVRERRLMFQ